MRRKHAIAATAGICAVAAIGAGGGLGLAQSGDSSQGSDVISACAKDQEGQLRIVGSSEPCGPSEYPLTWPAQQSSGGIMVRQVGKNVVVDQDREFVFVSCTDGWVVTGGGGEVQLRGGGSPVGKVAMTGSGPADFQNPGVQDAWKVRAERASTYDGEYIVNVWAMCTPSARAA